MIKRLSKKKAQEIRDLETGIAALAVLTGGAQVLHERFCFTEAQRNEWVELTKAQMLVNKVAIVNKIRQEQLDVN